MGNALPRPAGESPSMQIFKPRNDPLQWTLPEQRRRTGQSPEMPPNLNWSVALGRQYTNMYVIKSLYEYKIF